jgi:nucleoside-diphosphate-sugar epimerase
MTDRLIAAMSAAGTRRLVLVSSLSVLDYASLREGDVVDESSPLELRPERRDDYARAKLLQESAASSIDRELVIVRPGAIVGGGRWWTPRLGYRLPGEKWIQVGRDAELPLVHVDHCARVVLAAATTPIDRFEPGAGGRPIIHALDEDRPIVQSYVDQLVNRGEISRPIARWGYRFARRLAGSADAILRPIPVLARVVPGALNLARVDARFKPFRYADDRARALLHAGV